MSIKFKDLLETLNPGCIMIIKDKSNHTILQTSAMSIKEVLTPSNIIINAIYESNVNQLHPQEYNTIVVWTDAEIY
jgi:hypothetical protein